jgi:hypothetical protein
MAPQPEELRSQQDNLIACLQALDEVLSSSASVLNAARGANRQFGETISEGRPLRDAFASISVPETMSTVTQELKKLEIVRHRTRTAVFTLGLAEDMSIGELARLYGFSRQLAQRYAHEARQAAIEHHDPGQV